MPPWPGSTSKTCQPADPWAPGNAHDGGCASHRCPRRRCRTACSPVRRPRPALALTRRGSHVPPVASVGYVSATTSRSAPVKLLTPDRVYLAVFAQVLEDAVRLELDPHGVGAEGPADVWCSRHGLAPAGSHQPRGVRRTSRLPTVTARSLTSPVPEAHSERAAAGSRADGHRGRSRGTESLGGTLSLEGGPGLGRARCCAPGSRRRTSADSPSYKAGAPSPNDTCLLLCSSTSCARSSWTPTRLSPMHRDALSRAFGLVVEASTRRRHPAGRVDP